MAGTSNDNLSTILDKMHLEHLIEKFQREKLTVGQICKLSSEEMDPEHHRSFDVDGLSSRFRHLHDRPYDCCHRASSSERLFPDLPVFALAVPLHKKDIP